MKRKLLTVLLSVMGIMCFLFAFTGCSAGGEQNHGGNDDTYFTEGLEFTLLKDDTYSVKKGTATDSNIIIPAQYNGKPLTSVDNFAFENCTNLESIKIPAGVTSIGSGAFYNCTNLTGITIPDGVTSIGSGAFYNCIRFKSISLPGSVTSIGDSAFWLCKSLESVNIPEGVTSVADRTFCLCASLVNITLPASVTSIGEGAFFECTNLTSITIPAGVISIGPNVFGGCLNLKNVTVENTTGWEVSHWSDMREAENVTVTDDAAQNAELLKNTYWNYYWRRNDA